MRTYLRPQILDRWVSILSELQPDQWRSYRSTHSGGWQKRMNELTKAGLIQSHRGCRGGYRLALPLSDITLGHLLAIFPRQLCPTLKLFYLYRQVSIRAILDWDDISPGQGKASLESMIYIISRLSLTRPTPPTKVAGVFYSLGYVEQIFVALTKLGLADNYQRRGKILVKPFDAITLGDIAPALSHRGNIHAKLVSMARGVTLCDLQVIKDIE